MTPYCFALWFGILTVAFGIGSVTLLTPATLTSEDRNKERGSLGIKVLGAFLICGTLAATCARLGL